MKYTFKPFIILIAFLYCSLINLRLIAQDGGVKITNKSDKIEIVNGKKYYFHTVLQGQTLYSISKAYSISVDQIVKDNPEVTSNPISPGQKLKISAGSQQVKVKKDSIITHIVKGKETLYNLSKKYDVTEEDIKNANPDQNMNLQIGQVIKIPYRPDTTEKKKTFIQKIFNKSESKSQKPETGSQKPEVRSQKKPDTTLAMNIKIEEESGCKEYARSEMFKVALLLPLSLGELDDIKTEEIDGEIKPPSFYKSLTYIQYYEGAMIALDSLKNQGLNMKFYVYDVNNDSTLIGNIIQKPEFTSLNLILCPQYKSSYASLLKQAKKHNIKLATYTLPLANKEQRTAFSEQMFLLAPTLNEQFHQLSQFITKKYSNDNIIVVYQSNNNDKRSADLMQKELNADISKDLIKGFKMHDMSKEDFTILKGKLSSTSNNIIISYLSDEVLISQYIRYLNNIKDSYKIILFGSQSWENFQNVEKDYLENLNLHLYSANYIDYSRPMVKLFIHRFRKDYGTEPNIYAYLGFDATYFFMNAMFRYGKSFEKCLQSIKPELLDNEMHFQKTENNIYENTYLNIFKYEDYKLVNARTHD